jgi:hypothetical protein
MAIAWFWDLSQEWDDEVDLHYSYDMARRIEQERELENPKIVWFEVEEGAMRSDPEDLE